MKAKHIKAIKGQMKYYNVWVTPTLNMFGVSAYGNPKCRLLARNPCEAARRAARKGLRPQDVFLGESSNSRFGRYAVRESNKVSERFTTYWE